MIAIGDSHVRAFASREGIKSIFVGPGKEYNFISQSHAESVIKAIFSIEDIIQGQDVILFFGEPDTRFALGKGWHPWNYERIQDDVNNDTFVLNCAKRFVSTFSSLINEINAEFNILLLVYTPNANQCRYIDLFNKYVAENMACNVIDINSKVSNDGVLDKFYQLDVIHSNREIVEVVLKKVKNKNKLEAVRTERLKFNKKFGCYCFRNKSSVKIYLEKIISLFIR